MVCRSISRSVSHRPTLITTFESLIHCAAKVGGTGKNRLVYNLMRLNYWPCVIVCDGFSCNMQTKYMQLAARLWVQVLYISVLSWNS